MVGYKEYVRVVFHFKFIHLILVVREGTENDNLFLVRILVKPWYFIPKSQHLGTYVRIYKMTYYSLQEVRNIDHV